MSELPICNDATFEAEVTQRPGAVLVSFGAPWCAPCHAMDPVLASLAAEGRVHALKMNVDENMTVPTRFGVRALPTLILFRDGTPVGQLVGNQPRASIDHLLKTSGHPPAGTRAP